VAGDELLAARCLAPYGADHNVAMLVFAAAMDGDEGGACQSRVTRCNPISIGLSIWDTGNRYGIWYIDMVTYRIGMVILDIDMGYGLMIWEMTVSIRSSPVSIWDILSICQRLLEMSFSACANPCFLSHTPPILCFGPVFSAFVNPRFLSYTPPALFF